MCRRLSGAGYSTWVSVPRIRFRLTGGAGRLAVFAVSTNSTRCFCKICGTAVQTLDSRYPDIVGVLLGTVAGDVGQAPSVHAFFDSKAAWVSIGDDLPCLSGASGFEPLDTPPSEGPLIGF
jgi:hypothetical protein